MSSIAQRCLQLQQGAVVVTMSAPLALFLPTESKIEDSTNPHTTGTSSPEATGSLPSSRSEQALPNEGQVVDHDIENAGGDCEDADTSTAEGPLPKRARRSSSVSAAFRVVHQREVWLGWGTATMFVSIRC